MLEEASLICTKRTSLQQRHWRRSSASKRTLYTIETAIRGESAEVRLDAMREEYAIPLLEEHCICAMDDAGPNRGGECFRALAKALNYAHFESLGSIVALYEGWSSGD